MKLHRRIVLASLPEALAPIADRCGPLIGTTPLACWADLTGAEMARLPDVAVFAHLDEARTAYPSLPWVDLIPLPVK